MAAHVCAICGEATGYGVRFYNEGGISRQLVHAACLERQVEKGRVQRMAMESSEPVVYVSTTLRVWEDGKPVLKSRAGEIKHGHTRASYRKILEENGYVAVDGGRMYRRVGDEIDAGLADPKNYSSLVAVVTQLLD